MGPLSRAELAPTLRPLLEASMLPPRAYADEDSASSEAEHVFLGGWVCVGHVSAAARRGAYLTREIGGESVLVVATREAARARSWVVDFDRSCFGLTPVRSAVVGGLLPCYVSAEGGPAGEHVGALAEHLDRYRAGELQRGARIAYDVGANWKAIVENYSECLHCPGVHPELNRLATTSAGGTSRGRAPGAAGR